MARVSEQDVLEALKAIADPDRGQDIVDLGMISGLVVKDGNVGFAIEVDPQRGVEMEPLRKQAEEIIDKLPGVLSVTAVLTAHRAGSGNAAPAAPSGPSAQAPAGGPAAQQASGAGAANALVPGI